MKLLHEVKRKIKLGINIIRGGDAIIKRDVVLDLCNVGNYEMDSAFICLDKLMKKKEIIIVSAGIGDQINFELDIMERLKDKRVILLAIDPTPKSLKFLSDSVLPDDFVVVPYALCGKNEELSFALPAAEGWTSGSTEELLEDGRQLKTEIKVQGKTLKTILEEHGIEKIDLLKMDIEGSEFDVLDNILSDGIPVEQMTIDLHHHIMKNNTHLVKNLIDKLHKSGYQICYVDKMHYNICCVMAEK